MAKVSAPYGFPRRLSLEGPTRSPDGAGGYALSWVTLGALWADVTPGATRDILSVGGATAEAGLAIRVRGSPMGAPARPRPGQRFREGTRLYRIDSVTEAEPLGRVLLCLAHEEVAPS